MSDLRQYSRQFLKEWIEIYRNLPCLWNTKCREYSNRNKKAKAYAILVNKFREVELPSQCNRDMIVKKINSLRSCYRKEMRKVKESLRSGASPEDVYKPKLWYYDLLSFLEEQDTLQARVVVKEGELSDFSDDLSEPPPLESSASNQKLDSTETTATETSESLAPITQHIDKDIQDKSIPDKFNYQTESFDRGNSRDYIFVKELIELYRGYPCLWDSKCREYSHRDKKSAAYEVLVKKFKEVDPHCTRTTVVRKLNSLRSCYRKEVNKVRASLRYNVDPEDVYKPKLWYYDLLTFLEGEKPQDSSILIKEEDISDISEDYWESALESSFQKEPSTAVPSMMYYENDSYGNLLPNVNTMLPDPNYPPEPLTNTFNGHYSRDFITDVIAIYRSHPCLWNFRIPEFGDSVKRGKAMEIIVNKFKEIDPHANRDKVVNKIHALRSCYQREFRKVKKSLRSALSPNDVYIPRLWYFNLLRFIDCRDPLDSSMSSIKGEDTSDESDDCLESAPESSVYSQKFDAYPTSVTTGKTVSTSISCGSVTRPLKRNRPDADDSGDKLLPDMDTNSTPMSSQSELYFLSKSWAISMQELPRDQQLLAKRLINEVIFRAQMGKLTTDTDISK